MTELHGKIYLTKADIPKSCNQCPFCNGADECMVQNEDANFLADTWDDLRRGCPLEEIDSVTVQEWISVKEHLPQDDLPFGALCEIVQVLLDDGTVTVGWCNRGLKCWYYMPIQATNFVGHDYDNTPVIAWQPLAQPPKGE